MGNKVSLEDNLINLKMVSKQMLRSSKKCEKNEKEKLAKLKKVSTVKRNNKNDKKIIIIAIIINNNLNDTHVSVESFYLYSKNLDCYPLTFTFFFLRSSSFF